MKKIFTLALSVMLTTIAMSHEGTTVSTANNGKAPAKPKDIVIKERHIETTYYFKTTKLDTPHYGQFEVSINWPESCDGYDISKLQEALAGKGGKAEGLIQSYCDELFNQELWTRVNSKPEEENYDMIESEYYEMPFPPDGAIALRRVDCHNPGLAIYELSGYLHPGCGMGACTFMLDTVVMFDIAQNRRIGYSDIFTAKAEPNLLKMLKKVHGDDTGEIDEMWLVKRVPRNISIENDTCYFIFEKYEIDCGAAGTVRLEIPMKNLQPYMTPYAKELFRRKN